MNEKEKQAFVSGRAGKCLAGLAELLREISAGANKSAGALREISSRAGKSTFDLLLQREKLIKKIKRNREIAEKIQPEKYKDLSGYHAALANCQRHAWELGRRIRKIEHRLNYDQLDQFPLLEWELPPSTEVFISKSKIRKLQKQRKR